MIKEINEILSQDAADKEASGGRRPSACSVSLRTNFGFPWRTRKGAPMALWSSDIIKILRSSGGWCLCRVNPNLVLHTFDAWIPKKRLRFRRQNVESIHPESKP